FWQGNIVISQHRFIIYHNFRLSRWSQVGRHTGFLGSPWNGAGSGADVRLPVIGLITKEMLSRYQSGRGSVFTSLIDGPNLFAPSGSALASLAPQGRADADLLRNTMFGVTLGERQTGVTLRERQWDWTARRDAVDALVR